MYASFFLIICLVAFSVGNLLPGNDMPKKPDFDNNPLARDIKPFENSNLNLNLNLNRLNRRPQQGVPGRRPINGVPNRNPVRRPNPNPNLNPNCRGKYIHRIIVRNKFPRSNNPQMPQNPINRNPYYGGGRL